jgi:outer membrane protein, heavy metal efflux system
MINHMKLIRLVALALTPALTTQRGLPGNTNQPFQPVERLVRERAGKALRWPEDQAGREANLRQIRALLKKPLEVRVAVQIALYNNSSLQATFEEVGLSAADLREAGTFPNPTFNLSARFPDKPPSGTDLEYSAAIDFLNILMIPLKKRVAKDQLESTILRVADETLELVSRVKKAFYSLQASQQLLNRLKLIADANAAALNLSQRQHEAGNITDLALAEQQAAYSRSRLDVAMAETDIRQNREKLNRLLGLWGEDTDWKFSGDLPPIPGSKIPVQGLERLAITQRLDLQADFRRVASLAKALRLEKDFRFLGALDFGIDSERSSDSQTITGPTFAIQIPIFNQQGAKIARSEAVLRQAEKRLEGLAVDVRSEVRELWSELESKRQIAHFYEKELLPNEVQILNQSILNYNAMAIGNFELFTAKAEEARTEREYLEAVKEYWITRAELERVVGGNLRMPSDRKDSPRSETTTLKGQAPSRPREARETDGW